MSSWINIGKEDDLKLQQVQEVSVGHKKVALSFVEGKFGAIQGTCTHVGGPLGQGCLAGEYLVCPWHQWKFHRVTGKAEPGFEDAIPKYEVKVEKGEVFVSEEPSSKGNRKVHPPHPLARPIKRADGPIRVAGISTTAMDAKNPRYSTSDALLGVAIDHAKTELKCDTKLIKLNDLHFRNCEGYYSKAARACTWPCSITQMDKEDELTEVYDALVHWADVILVSTPIRWGAASSLYFKMAERLNCIQNQQTTNNRILIQNKVAGFIITGGQDNIQGVAGQMLTFFTELGFHLPQFPFIAHSRGWSAEDMENNVKYVKNSKDLQEGARALAARAIETSKNLLKLEQMNECGARGGRKAHALQV